MSTLFSPILVPAYCVFIALQASVLSMLPLSTKVWVTLITFGITGVLPMLGIMALYLTKRVSDPGLNNRTERTLPYVITGVCYGVCAFFLYKSQAPEWLWLFPVGGGVAVIVSTIVNRWWKISAHLAGMGGMIGMLARMAADGVAAPGIMWWLTAAVLITGLLGTSRVVLGRHTLGQVLCGTLNGFLCVYLITMY